MILDLLVSLFGMILIFYAMRMEHRILLLFLFGLGLMKST